MKTPVVLAALMLAATGCAALKQAGDDFARSERESVETIRCERTEGCAPPARIRRARSGPVRANEPPAPAPEYLNGEPGR